MRAHTLTPFGSFGRLFYRDDGFAFGYFETDTDFATACEKMDGTDVVNPSHRPSHRPSRTTAPWPDHTGAAGLRKQD